VLQDILGLNEIKFPVKEESLTKHDFALPIALDLSKPGLPQFELSLSSGPHFWITGMPQSGKTSLLQTWLLSMAECYSPAAARFYIVDLGWGNFEALKNLPHCIGCVTDAADFKIVDIKEQLNEYLNLDLSGSKPALIDGSDRPTTVFAIDGIGAFQKATGSGTGPVAEKNRDFLLSLLRIKNARFHMLATGVPTEFSGGMTMNPLGEILRGFQRGIWLGDGTNGEATNFNFQFNQGENLKGLPKGVAFSVQRGKYTPLKLATCHIGTPSMDEWIQKLRKAPESI